MGRASEAPTPPAPATVRVALAIQATVETYDADGQLTGQQPVQPVMVAGLTAAALTTSAEGAIRQIVGVAWPTPVGDTEG